MYLFELEPKENYQPYVVVNDVLTPAECESILRLERQFTRGEVHGDDGSMVAPEYRSCDVAQFQWTTGNSWLFDRVADTAIEANRSHFRFDLTGFLEGFALLRYSESDHHAWHSDYGPGVGSLRKLSVVVFLSDPSTHQGGRLMLHDDGSEGVDVTGPRGSVLLFTPFVPHRVTRVDSGIRHVLLGWVYGPPFR